MSITVNKLRNEDLSIYAWLLELIGDKVKRVVDAFPYTEIEDSTLVIPSASVQHRLTEEGTGELGSSWYRRTWAIDVFADNDSQRDELGGIIYDALDFAIPIKDFSGGFYIINNVAKKDAIGTDLSVIELISPEDRVMKPMYSFGDPSITYWRVTIVFDTESTKVNSA